MTTPRWLATRALVPEVMDDPALDASQHHRALQALGRINFLSATAAILWRPIRELARRLRVDRLRVLDIASGGGDVPLALWRKAKRAGVNLDITGVDFSERAVHFAQQRADLAAVPIRFQQLDALQQDLPQDYDVVMCSLFLHHLTTPDAERLVQAMAVAARKLVVVNDLNRSALGWCLAYGAGRLLTRSPVVRVDAVLSVQAAFSMQELREIAGKAPLDEVKVASRFPCRMLLTGVPKSANG